MNDFDRDNFEFFVYGDPYEFELWCDQATTEDLAYAMMLIRQGRQELEAQYNSLMDNVEDVTQASDLLKQFTLKK